MNSKDGKAERDFASEIEAVHVRQNLQEDREIRQGLAIKKLQDDRADHRDWIIRALGPVQQTLLGLNERMKQMEKALQKLVVALPRKAKPERRRG